METHHDQVEWALANVIDPAPLLADFPAMGAADEPHLRAWHDSDGNMMVLCVKHHRAKFYGTHMITGPIWKAQRWFRKGLDLVTGQG